VKPVCGRNAKRYRLTFPHTLNRSKIQCVETLIIRCLAILHNFSLKKRDFSRKMIFPPSLYPENPLRGAVTRRSHTALRNHLTTDKQAHKNQNVALPAPGMLYSADCPDRFVLGALAVRDVCCGSPQHWPGLRQASWPAASGSSHSRNTLHEAAVSSVSSRLDHRDDLSGLDRTGSAACSGCAQATSHGSH
jgi:hypothetical protein